MTVTILDIKTGKTARLTGCDPWAWAEGNWSCACNRAFGVKDEFTTLCLGCHRFIVVKAEFEEGETKYTIEELNDGYPQDMVKMFAGALVVTVSPSRQNG